MTEKRTISSIGVSWLFWLKIRIIHKGDNNKISCIPIKLEYRTFGMHRDSMKRTDKDLLVKGIKSFVYTALIMFIAPVVLYQAFKNTDKPLFIPVLVIGIALAGFAIYMGFRSVNIVMDAVFGKKKSNP